MQFDGKRVGYWYVLQLGGTVFPGFVVTFSCLSARVSMHTWLDTLGKHVVVNLFAEVSINFSFIFLPIPE